MPTKLLSHADLGTVARLTVLVAIDLIIRNVRDEVLLGLRNNEPALGVFQNTYRFARRVCIRRRSQILAPAPRGSGLRAYARIQIYQQTPGRSPLRCPPAPRIGPPVS